MWLPWLSRMTAPCWPREQMMQRHVTACAHTYPVLLLLQQDKPSPAAWGSLMSLVQRGAVLDMCPGVRAWRLLQPASLQLCVV